MINNAGIVVQDEHLNLNMTHAYECQNKDERILRILEPWKSYFALAVHCYMVPHSCLGHFGHCYLATWLQQKVVIKMRKKQASS